MKNISMIVTSWCPHCKNARKWMAELLEENPKYQSLSIEIIDEENETDKLKPYFSYYYVPTYYVGEHKAHEGVPSKELIRQVLEEALAE